MSGFGQLGAVLTLVLVSGAKANVDKSFDFRRSDVSSSESVRVLSLLWSQFNILERLFSQSLH